MLQTVIPAFSPEAVRAAVQNGADVVYTDFSRFSESGFAETVKYCRIRAVKVCLSLERMYRDSELADAVKQAEKAFLLGAWAVEVADLGLLRTLRAMFPTGRLHLGPMAGIHSAAGVAAAAHLGADRVVLSPQLSAKDLKEIMVRAKPELELVCHGPVCAAVPGTCRMSAFTDKGAACFGSCSRPCRRSFRLEGEKGSFGLSLRELCLADRISHLEGLTAIRVLGRDRGPEYSALTARVYSRVARGEKPGRADLKLLEQAFAPAGMTGGFFDQLDPVLLYGKQEEDLRRAHNLTAEVRHEYMNHENRTVPVRMAGYVRRGEPLRMAARDPDGNMVELMGAVPAPAGDKAGLSSVQLKTHLYNLSPFPYECEKVAVSVDAGLHIPSADIIALRKKVLEELSRKRAAFTPLAAAAQPPMIEGAAPAQTPDINVYVRRTAQLSRALAGIQPRVLYVPIDELVAHPGAITPFWENGVTDICAVLPPTIHASEEAELLAMLDRMKEIHVTQVLVSDPGQIALAGARGFLVRADLAMGAYNAAALQTLKEWKVSSVALPPELSFADIRTMAKALPVEVVLYGRVVLMTAEGCVIKAARGGCDCEKETQLRDRRNVYPVFRSYPCRSELFSAEKLFLPRRRDMESLGLWCARLDFTTESAEECVQIAQRFLGQNRYDPPGKTRGLY